MYVCMVYVFWEKVNEMYVRNKKHGIKAGDPTSLKMGKKTVLVLAVLLVVGVVVTGNLLTFYGSVTNSNTIETLFEINDNSSGSPSGWMDCEEYSIVYDTSSLFPGDSISWEFTLKLNSSASSSKTMYFGITDCSSDGVAVTIAESGCNISSYEFAPGDIVVFVYTIATDAYTPGGVYNTTVMFTAS